MDKEQNITLDLKAQNKNLEVLKKHFPQCFKSDGSFDFDKFKQELSENEIDFYKESYGLDWLGKSYARVLATDSVSTLLKEDIEFNQKPENKDSQNLLIKGDNLEVLKHLSHAYYEKVKMIYIDPPYNTGGDGFVYQDDRKFTVEELQKLAGVNEEKAKRILDFTHSKSNSHSAWLTFMYPRLYVARQLLKEDGVIFISIDDNEVAQLKVLCDEIFGEENFINTVSVNMKNIAGASGGGEDKKLKKNIEYLHVYTKNYEHFTSFENIYDFIPIDQMVEQYRNDGKSWKYTSVLVYEGDKEYFASTVDGDGNEIKIFTRKNPIIKSINAICKDENLSEKDAYFKYSKQIFQTAMPQSSIRPRVMKKVSEIGSDEDFFSIEYVPKTGKNKGQVYEQYYRGNSFRLLAWLRDVSCEVDGVLCKKELQGTYWDFASETKNLSKEGNIAFPNGKKPLKMLKRLVSMQKENDAIILDFFAGSGSTAHAVLELNSKDYGTRKCISIQINEPISKSDKLKFYKNEKFNFVFDITKERLIRAAQKIREENPDTSNQDLGFKIFETTPIWDDYYFDEDEFHPQVTMFDENPLLDVDIQSLFLTWKTYDGSPLTEQYQKYSLDGYNGYYVNNKLYLMDKGFKTDHLKSLLEKIDSDKEFNPTSVIAFGYNFESKSLREISENIKSYANKKSIDIDFITRY